MQMSYDLTASPGLLPKPGQYMTMRTLVLALIVTASLATASESEPISRQAEFLWHSRFSYSDMVRASSLIIIGEVQSVVAVGSPARARDETGEEGLWQLLKVRTSVEHVAKGVIRERLAEFSFYMLLGSLSGNWNSLDEGHRYIFFLTVRDGTLRAVRDFWRSSLEVGTGRHAKLPLNRTHPVEERLAILGLTPGEGLEPRRFQRVIFQAMNVALDWLGPCRTATLLKELTKYSNDDVRNSSRTQLTQLGLEPEECP